MVKYIFVSLTSSFIILWETYFFTHFPLNPSEVSKHPVACLKLKSPRDPGTATAEPNGAPRCCCNAGLTWSKENRRCENSNPNPGLPDGPVQASDGWVFESFWVPHGVGGWLFLPLEAIPNHLFLLFWWFWWVVFFGGENKWLKKTEELIWMGPGPRVREDL